MGLEVQERGTSYISSLAKYMYRKVQNSTVGGVYDE